MLKTISSNNNSTRLMRTFTQSPVAEIITDLEDNIQDVNNKFTELTGFSRTEAHGEKLQTLLSQKTDKDLEKSRLAKLSAGSDWHGELENKTKEGNLQRVYSYVSPLRDDQEVITHYLTVMVAAGNTESEADKMNSWFLHNIAENVKEVFWILDCASNALSYISPSFEEIWGIPVDQAYKSTKSWLATIHKGDRARVQRALKANKYSTGQYNEEYRIVRPDGSTRWIRERAFPICTNAGDVYRIIGIAEDITANKRADAILIGEKQALELIARGEPLSAILDLLVSLVEEQVSGLVGSVLLYDDTRHRLLHGAAPKLPKQYKKEIDGLAVWPGSSPASTAIQSKNLVFVSKLAEETRWPRFSELALKAGFQACWITPVVVGNKAVAAFCGYSNEQRNPLQEEWELILRIAHMVGVAIERKNSETRIAHLANYDDLTGLPNRSLIGDLLKQSLTLAARNKRLVGVMFMDIDRFKTINDTLGHDAGDLLIKVVAERVNACLRRGDAMARLGGDEFIIVLADMGHSDDVMRITQKILGTFSQPFNIMGRDLFITASIGVSVFPLDGTEIDSLMKNADSAMYRAKEHGRNTYRFYTAEMNAKAYDRLVLENSLHQAVQRKEFLLHYQPQMDAVTGKMIGMEALVRWQHPEIGLIPPFEFIPLSEETGLIVAIGEWVLRTACEQNVAWSKRGLTPMRVAVNLSPRQFRQPNLVQMILSILEETGLDPEYLELEITESTLMQNVDTTIANLKELKEHGIHLSIDDFGTGYSSLNYLKRFPIDCLKVDRSFVQDIINDEDDAAITRAIINLAHHLDIQVIAEGVETKDQLTFLQNQLCDFIQGYYFSKPLAAADLERMLAEQKPLPTNAKAG